MTIEPARTEGAIADARVAAARIAAARQSLDPMIRRKVLRQKDSHGPIR